MVLANQTSTGKKVNVDTALIPFATIKSKLTTSLKVRHKTMKLPEDNLENNLENIKPGNDFLETMQKTRII